MTANQIFGSVQAITCTHTSIVPGLDSIQCRNCRRMWPSWHPDFNRLLNQPTISAPDTNSSVCLEQLTISAPDTNSSVCLEQLTISAPDTNSSACLEQPTINHWIETYSPAHRDTYYYRYVWMDGRRLHHLHIPGGNIKSAIALYRKTEVKRWITLGRSPQKIQDLIKSWRKV